MRDVVVLAAETRWGINADLNGSFCRAKTSRYGAVLRQFREGCGRHGARGLGVSVGPAAWRPLPSARALSWVLRRARGRCNRATASTARASARGCLATCSRARGAAASTTGQAPSPGRPAARTRERGTGASSTGRARCATPVAGACTAAGGPGGSRTVRARGVGRMGRRGRGVGSRVTRRGQSASTGCPRRAGVVAVMRGLGSSSQAVGRRRRSGAVQRCRLAGARRRSDA